MTDDKLRAALDDDDLAKIIRDEAYPEFGAAPPPLWAVRAAQKVRAALAASATDEGPDALRAEREAHAITRDHLEACRKQRNALAASATDEGPRHWHVDGGWHSARPAVPALDVDVLGAAWLNLWGGSPETPPNDAALLALHDLLTALAREYAALSEKQP